ncbi:hypothetical protein ABZ923_00140 [Streptomyces sp. NPDC046881]|uniref:hypothetical protein n=1 Tax=Streptomyces sp. NPDC046881 TaxID=3155374 RepID=UPI0033F2A6C2
MKSLVSQLCDAVATLVNGASSTGTSPPPTSWCPRAAAIGPTSSVSHAGDWWSVGMVVAQLPLSRHPVELRRNEEVLAEIATHDPDVGGGAHRRTRLLCGGLLTRALVQRWQADEVRAWPAGQDRRDTWSWVVPDGLWEIAKPLISPVRAARAMPKADARPASPPVRRRQTPRTRAATQL